MWDRLDRGVGLIICIAFVAFLIWKGIALLPVSETVRQWISWSLWGAFGVYALVLFIRQVRFSVFGGGANTLK